MIVEYFVGGAADKNDFLSKVVGNTGVMNTTRRLRAASKVNITTFYKGHEEENNTFLEIDRKWKNNEISTLNLVGHSWGGQAVMNLTKKLNDAGIPVTELITLDPVSLLPFRPIKNFSHWVNVHQKQSIVDAIASVPIAGNFVGSILSAISIPFGGSVNDTIATIGGQLGYQNGATNIVCGLDHADAWGMYVIARQKMDTLLVK